VLHFPTFTQTAYGNKFHPANLNLLKVVEFYGTKQINFSFSNRRMNFTCYEWDRVCPNKWLNSMCHTYWFLCVQKLHFFVVAKSRNETRLVVSCFKLAFDRIDYLQKCRRRCCWKGPATTESFTNDWFVFWWLRQWGKKIFNFLQRKLFSPCM